MSADRDLAYFNRCDIPHISKGWLQHCIAHFKQLGLRQSPLWSWDCSEWQKYLSQVTCPSSTKHLGEGKKQNSRATIIIIIIINTGDLLLVATSAATADNRILWSLMGTLTDELSYIITKSVHYACLLVSAWDARVHNTSVNLSKDYVTIETRLLSRYLVVTLTKHNQPTALRKHRLLLWQNM